MSWKLEKPKNLMFSLELTQWADPNKVDATQTQKIKYLLHNYIITTTADFF